MPKPETLPRTRPGHRPRRVRPGQRHRRTAGLKIIFFSVITRKAIRRGSFTSVKELTEKIRTFIASYNTDCTPFTWTKPADIIIGKAHGKRRTTFVKNGTSITRY